MLVADGAEKEARLRKLPRKPVKFEGMRDDEIKHAEDDLKAASACHVRADVHALLFGKDFRAHIKAVEHLEAALSESPDAVEGTLDLLLRWVVLRLCEQAPNTQSLLKVLDFTADALAVVKDRGARLSEQEGALFLPALVDKCGHPMEAVREKFRRIVRLVPGVFPASKVAGYLVRGLDSKNTKTRLEVLDVMGSLMERHGLDVVERAGNRALAEVAKLADQARDVGMRSAALACLVTAYKVGGDDAWRHLGRLSDSLRDALEEKFAKAAREMERRNEGLPGDGPGASRSRAAPRLRRWLPRCSDRCRPWSPRCRRCSPVGGNTRRRAPRRRRSGRRRRSPRSGRNRRRWRFVWLAGPDRSTPSRASATRWPWRV